MENYRRVRPAGRWGALQGLESPYGYLFTQPVLQVIDAFVSDQNLTLAAGKTWRTVTANIFSVVDGKRILFENNDSLFHTLRKGDPSVEVLRERVAAAMTADEIHDDVHRFFAKLMEMMGTVPDVSRQQAHSTNPKKNGK